MGPHALVDRQPGVGQGAEFRDRLDEWGIEHLRATGAIEAFDVGILLGLPGLK